MSGKLRRRGDLSGVKQTENAEGTEEKGQSGRDLKQNRDNPRESFKKTTENIEHSEAGGVSNGEGGRAEDNSGSEGDGVPPVGGKRKPQKDDLWLKVKNNWRLLLIMSLTAGSAGFAGGILGTLFCLSAVKWHNGPYTEITKFQDQLDQANKRAEEFYRQTKVAINNSQISNEAIVQEALAICAKERMTLNLESQMDAMKNDVLTLTAQQLKDNITKVKQEAKEDNEQSLTPVRKDLRSVKEDLKQYNYSLQSKADDFDEKLQLANEEFKTALSSMRDNLTQTTKDQIDAMGKKIAAVKSETEASCLRNLSESMEKVTADLNRTCETRIQQTNDDNKKTLEVMKEEIVQKFSNVDNRQDFIFTLIHQLGFMKFDTWGPLVLLLAVVEVVTILFVCRQAARTGGALVAGDARNDRANGEVTQPARSSRRAMLLREAGDRGRNTLCVVCFRRKDLQRVRTLSDSLVQAARHAQRVRIESCLVDTRNDIQGIPACRAALVFVDPDERMMILEDRRHHMGGDRRDTVQELLDTQTDVLLVIYDDPTEGGLGGEDLYSHRLSQIREHALLKELDQKRRIISIKRGGAFTDSQKHFIATVLDQNFG